MTIRDIAESLKLTLLCGHMDDCPEITGGFAGDMLSEVIGNAREGQIWVTVQTHMNVIAVAVLKGVPIVIFAMGNRPEMDVIAKASDEGILLFSSGQTAFDIAGELYDMGIRGGRK